MHKIVLYTQSIQPRVVELIAAEKCVVTAGDLGALQTALKDADGLVIQDPAWSADVAKLAKAASKLHWVQLLTSGYNNLVQHGAPDGVAITNARGAFSPAVAVHAVSLYLSLLRNIPLMTAQKEKNNWDRAFASKLITPAETKVMIAGYGSIGEEIAHLLKNFSPWIVGVNRTGNQHYLADEMIESAALRDTLPDMDAVFLSLPLNDKTHHIINEQALASMKSNAVLINVGRGGLIDSAALAQALHDGQIAGAAIDVTEPEPLPSNHPLWDAPNLIISPHVSGAAGELGARRQAEVATHNIQRFVKGEPLENIVHV